MTEQGISAEALKAVGELLEVAEEYGLGIAFEPDGDGWRVNYISPGWPAIEDFQTGGGALSNAYTLDVAAEAAHKPLVEMGKRVRSHFTNQT